MFFEKLSINKSVDLIYIAEVANICGFEILMASTKFFLGVI